MTLLLVLAIKSKNFLSRLSINDFKVLEIVLDKRNEAHFVFKGGRITMSFLLDKK